MMDTSVRADAESGEESGSLDLPSIFVEALAEVGSRSDRRATELTTKAFDYLRREIKRNVAENSFKELTKGREPQELLWLLVACSVEPEPEPDRVSLIMGSDSRKLKAIVQKFRECAAQIDSINSAIVGQIFRTARLQLLTGFR